MQSFVELNKRNGRMKNFIGQMISDCPQKDYRCYAEAIYTWVAQRVKYVWDPHNVEMLQDPFFILSQSRVGDCDDMATLMAALYEFIDLPARFVTIKADPNYPNEFSHVYTEVKIPRTGWIGADVTESRRGFGWIPGPQFPRAYWPATRERKADSREDKLGGLGMLRDWLTTKQPDVSAPVAHPFLGAFGEGPIENVTFFPRYIGPQGDYRIDVPARNLRGMGDDITDAISTIRQQSSIQDAPLDVLQNNPGLIQNLTPLQQNIVLQRLKKDNDNAELMRKAAIVLGAGFLVYLVLKSFTGGKRK